MEEAVTKDRLVQFGDGSLPKANILHLAADFQKIKADGRYRSGRLMTIGFFRAEDIDFKVGFIVSKRIHKRAVKRNFAKRRMREALRLTRAKIDPNVWMVIIAKPAILKASAFQVQKELIYLTRKGKIWCD